MRFKLTATVTHTSFDHPVVHEFYYNADSRQSALKQISTLPQHTHNLSRYGKTAFKDQSGVKHKWVFEQVGDGNDWESYNTDDIDKH